MTASYDGTGLAIRTCGVRYTAIIIRLEHIGVTTAALQIRRMSGFEACLSEAAIDSTSNGYCSQIKGRRT
jgi:hypothetical protein